MTQNTKEQPKAKPKRQPPKPSPCLAAIAKPIDGLPLAYQWQPLGLFVSRKAARRVIDDLMQANPEITFVVLPQSHAGKSAFYDVLATAMKAD